MNHAFLVTQRHSAASLSPRRSEAPASADAQSPIRDTAVVDLGNWHSLQYWARWLGISEQQLIRATRVAGTRVSAIETHLAERRERRRRRREAALAER